MEIDPLLIQVIIGGVLQIIDRHKTSGTPVTAASIHTELLKELQTGQSLIGREFAAKGWTLPH